MLRKHVNVKAEERNFNLQFKVEISNTNKSIELIGIIWIELNWTELFVLRHTYHLDSAVRILITSHVCILLGAISSTDSSIFLTTLSTAQNSRRSFFCFNIEEINIWVSNAEPKQSLTKLLIKFCLFSWSLILMSRWFSE